MKFPAHKGAMYIWHNEHKNYYETVEQYCADMEITCSECGSPAEFSALLAGGEVWVVQWYPDSPVGFCRVAAATLERAVELANGVEP